MPSLLALAEAKQPWFWGVAGAVAATLLVLNVLLVVAVHGRRIRQFTRGRRTRRFRAHVEAVFAELDPATRRRDPQWLRKEITGFDELERPIAATMLIERLRPASEAERRQTRETLRDVGAIDGIARSTGSWMPWRRALAVRTLGWVGAAETVPLLLAKLGDRSRYVRETVVRALGRIGDPRALSALEELFLDRGRVGAGVAYDALVALGPAAAPVFATGLDSPEDAVRVGACFGVAAVNEPTVARSLLEPLLADEAAVVRIAAAEALGGVGGDALPPGLARAVADAQPGVRSAAVAALSAFDDPQAVTLALDALRDSTRDAAVRAGESLVRLARGPGAGPAAREALQRAEDEWPVKQAVALAYLGAV